MPPPPPAVRHFSDLLLLLLCLTFPFCFFCFHFSIKFFFQIICSNSIWRRLMEQLEAPPREIDLHKLKKVDWFLFNGNQIFFSLPPPSSSSLRLPPFSAFFFSGLASARAALGDRRPVFLFSFSLDFIFIFFLPSKEGERANKEEVMKCGKTKGRGGRAAGAFHHHRLPIGRPTKNSVTSTKKKLGKTR